MNGSTPGCSNASPRRPWLPMTGSSGSTSASVPWTAASTKHRPVARAPARTLVIGPSRAGSGRCSRNATASRSGGRPPARTATTPSCWNPHSLPQLSAACSPSARRCTSTAATTTALCVASSTAAASTTSSAPGVAKPAPRMARSSCSWGCAGPSNAPTPGCRTSGSSDATPTGASSTGSRNSPSRSCSSSPPSSSTGEPDGAHDHAYPLKLLVSAYGAASGPKGGAGYTGCERARPIEVTPSEPRVDEPLHRRLGLTDDELDAIVRLLDREPSELELAMYAVMWSEHCSYKSSKVHLARFPAKAKWVLVGPGEGAGVIDVGDGLAIAVRIESHNHPSAVEPYQGAATGVGGIIRDVFSMGARPIALMDPLRFGPLDDARTRYLFEGVVSGISGYGNAVGVPTVGGEVVFDDCYRENPLVNVLCLGLLPHARLVLARAEGAGNVAVLLGASTGRDGIGGASILASAGFDESAADKRPSVQVGDPFEEKKLIEACLALLDSGLAVGVQDLGAAGLSCAASETAAKAGAGMDVDIE